MIPNTDTNILPAQNRLPIELWLELEPFAYRIADYLLFRSSLEKVDWDFCISNICRATGISRGTVHKILQSFKVKGWVWQDDLKHYHFNRHAFLGWAEDTYIRIRSVRQANDGVRQMNDQRSLNETIKKKVQREEERSCTIQGNGHFDRVWDDFFHSEPSQPPQAHFISPMASTSAAGGLSSGGRNGEYPPPSADYLSTSASGASESVEEFHSPPSSPPPLTNRLSAPKANPPLPISNIVNKPPPSSARRIDPPSPGKPKCGGSGRKISVCLPQQVTRHAEDIMAKWRIAPYSPASVATMEKMFRDRLGDVEWAGLPSWDHPLQVVNRLRDKVQSEFGEYDLPGTK